MPIELRIQPNLVPPDWGLAEASARSLLTATNSPEAEVSVLLTDDEEIRSLNRMWRGIDKPTDVLSWPQEVAGDDPSPLAVAATVLGDVAISLDTARRQAAKRGWSDAEEVALLLVHGILHLLGHEDDSEEGAAGMRTVETQILGRPLEKTEMVSG